MHRTTWIYVHLPIYKSNIFFWKLHCLTAFPFLQTNENITFSPRTTTVRHTITKLITLIDEFRHIFAPPLPQLFLEWSAVLLIGVNFYKAARLEPPTFQTPRLSGFWAPHFFVTCNAYYETVFRGLPNNKMTPNDIHANQTTSFVRI